MDYRELIESKSDVMLGKPVIKGTRITVESILRKLSDGYSFDELLEIHPHLTLENIRATIAYAAAIVSNEEALEAEV